MNTVRQVSISRCHVPAFLMEAYQWAEAGQTDRALARLTATNLEQIHGMKRDDPQAGSCWILLGKTWRGVGRLKEAAQAYEQAIQARPEPVVWAELAGIYLDVGRVSEALHCCQEALATGQEAPDLKGLYASCLIQTGRVREGIEVLHDLVTTGQADPTQHSQYLWSLLYLPDTRPQDLFQECVCWGRTHTPCPTASRQYTNSPDRDRRLRIGYVSADFRHQSAAYTFEAMLDARDRQAIEMVGYGSVASPDEVTKRIQAKFDRYRDIRSMDDRQVEACIQQDGIDILVAMGGHTRGHRLGVLASRAAPIQVDHGSVTTVGMDQIQYRLTDEGLDPPASRRYYLEELVYLPGGLACYRPDDGMPVVGPLPALQNGHVTFGSFANHLKIHPGVVALWAAVLRQVPRSRLLIKCPGGHDPHVKAYLEGQLQACGMEARQIRVLGWIPKSAHWDLYNQIDIALDTYPFNGAVTSLEALWMGVPLVTLVGHVYVAREGLTILNRLGLQVLAATNPDQYIARAVALANNLEALAKIRSSLRQRMLASPLCDAQRFAREMEAAYRWMWHTWCDSQIKNQKSKIKNSEK